MPANEQVERVEHMVRCGVPWEHIEAYVEGLALIEEERAALWLIGWARSGGLNGLTELTEHLGRLPVG